MQEPMKRILRLVFGWVFIAFGIAGMFLPFLQGFLFLFIGLYLLSYDSRWAKRLLYRLKERYPKINSKFDEMKVKIEKGVRKLFPKKTTER